MADRLSSKADTGVAENRLEPVPRPRAIVVDLDTVIFLSVAGVRALHLATETAAAAGVTVRIAYGRNRIVYRALTATDVAAILAPTPTGAPPSPPRHLQRVRQPHPPLLTGGHPLSPPRWRLGVPVSRTGSAERRKARLCHGRRV
ncbi:STAS domain-containing protein [Amycolatopsis coloradensis]|uniref:STAS domain-containing protein n=1 Tax=Amycolatopsis coloradensis TaxID=76021 RepID=UPI001300DC3D